MKFPTWECPEGELIQGDCLKVMRSMKPQSVDLVLGSPPYENRRTYAEVGFDLTGQDWVDWMVKVVKASLRICKGLVAFVLEGKTEKFRWSTTPALLMADLHRAGIILRKPACYHRVSSIPGGGGYDWLRNDWEFIVCCTNTAGPLPWSDPKAGGKPPKWGMGGALSHYNKKGERVNRRRPAGYENGDVRFKNDGGVMVDIANPGNVITCNTGGGKMGSNISNENEAPFPEKIASLFIKCFCPPGGIVLDCFSGSGTVAGMAVKLGRKFIGIDLRESQIELGKRRVKQSRLRRGFGV